MIRGQGRARDIATYCVVLEISRNLCQLLGFLPWYIQAWPRTVGSHPLLTQFLRKRSQRLIPRREFQRWAETQELAW